MGLRTKPDYAKSLKVYDDLYGLIEFTPSEKKIIDSWPFRRLRMIKQMGLAYYVFPGATHTRFSHSLGVCHVAGRIAESVFRGVKDDKERLKRVKHARMAGLLHDIGHLPLSHTVEDVYKEDANHKIEERTKKALEEGSGYLYAGGSHGTVTATALGGSKYHEQLGVRIIENTPISRILKHEDYELELLKSAITGLNRTRALSHILHSDLDADRMDYMIRDAKVTGICYSQFDINYPHARWAP